MPRLAVVDDTAEPRVLIALLRAPMHALPALAAPAACGVYALHYNGPHPLYREISGQSRPIYVGSAENLRGRLSSHASTLTACRNLDVADFTIRLLPTLTPVDAVVAEQLLQDALRPPWNHPACAGFGSRRQGRRREGVQLATPWDSLHPGRWWSLGMTPRDPSAIAAAAMDIIRHRPDAS